MQAVSVRNKADELVVGRVKQQLMSRNVKLQVCQTVLFQKYKDGRSCLNPSFLATVVATNS